MNVTYEKKDAMAFIGYHTEIADKGFQKCPEFPDGGNYTLLRYIVRMMSPQIS